MKNRILLIASILIAFLSFNLSISPLFNFRWNIDNELYHYFASSQRKKVSKQPIKLFKITDKDFKKYGSWPWSPSLFATMHKNIAKCNPKLIVYNIAFSSYSKLDEKDDAFALALQNSSANNIKTVLSFLLSENDNTAISFTELDDRVLNKISKNLTCPHCSILGDVKFMLPRSNLIKHASALGYSEIGAASEETVRLHNLFYTKDECLIQSLEAAKWQLLSEKTAPTPLVVLFSKPHFEESAGSAEDLIAPVDNLCDKIRNKVVLIGGDKALGGQSKIPTGDYVSKSEVHASVFANIMGDFNIRPPWWLLIIELIMWVFVFLLLEKSKLKYKLLLSSSFGLLLSVLFFMIGIMPSIALYIIYIIVFSATSILKGSQTN